MPDPPITATISATPAQATAAVQKLGELYPALSKLKGLRLREGHLELDVDTAIGEVQARVDLVASPTG